MKDKIIAYIGCGSNLGNREALLNNSITLLGETEGIKVTSVSPFYNTEPVGYTDQPDFLNGVVELETILSPEDLLTVCMNIEQELHRKREIRWGPRTIDLDILLYGNQIIETEELSIPHPRMHERYFALKPLSDLTPDMVHPIKKISIKKLLEDLIVHDENINER